MITTLADETAAAALIASPKPAWLFKHSATCPISGAALEEIENYLTAHPGTPAGMVVVQSQRPLSNWVASTLKYTHQSPQLFLVKGGAVLWQSTHWSITAAAMAKATDSAVAG